MNIQTATVQPAAKPVAGLAPITAFAAAQMSDWVRERIEESTFLELAVCAFFFGAHNQMRKLSQESSDADLEPLIEVIMEIGNLSESKTVALLNTIHRLAERYYLIEHIVEQGQTAAERWLDCREEADPPLHALVRKYQGLTMFDLGVEGVNERYDQEQQALYATVDQSVGKLRRRTLATLLIAAALASLSVYLLYF